MTIFGDLIDEIKEKYSYKISYLTVAKYDYEQYLKTIESSTVTIQPDLNIQLTHKVKKKLKISCNILFTQSLFSDVLNCVSFSPEKWDLLVNKSKETSQHIGAEIKKIKPSTESNDLRVTDFTKITKKKMEFEPLLNFGDLIDK